MTTPDLPSGYLGLWRRSVIRRSDGSSDATTAVWWFQSPRFHLDLRIPVDRPAPASPAALAALPAEQLLRYGRQSGFAGITVVDGARCEWRPEIAFPAVGDELDVGFMRFDGADRLHEAGLDGSYDEDWVRLAASPMTGARLVSTDAAGETAIAYLLIGEQWAGWGIGRLDDRFPASHGEFSVLQKRGGRWRTLASNCPWLEQTAVFDGAELTAQAVRSWSVGSVVTLERRSWTVSDIA
jgi:hypothetical protein